MNNDILKISNIIDVNRIKPDKINMIVSGTGTGKSYFAINSLSDKTNIPRENILIVTSRSATRDQQLNYKNIRRIHEFNKFEVVHNKVNICTYNWFSDNYINGDILNDLEVIVFDEIHTLFTDITFNSSLIDILKYIKIFASTKMVIGMTATDIELYRNNYLNGYLNYLLDKPYHIHKVTKSFNIISKLRYVKNILDNVEGGTLYLTASSKRAIELSKEYKGTVVIGEQNKNYNDDIKANRLQLVKDKVLPHGVDKLFCTSCLREGFEILEESNIKNIFIESQDPNTIIQFIGRYRSNVENVFIIYNNCIEQKGYKDKMTRNQKSYIVEFKNYINNRPSRWIKHFNFILDSNVTIDIIKEVDVENMFLDYFEDNWINKYIYKDEDKQSILNKAIDLGMKKDKHSNPHTFNSLIKYLKSKGYNIQKERKSIEGKQYTRYYIACNF